jgi:hypothetical protein
LIYTSKFFDRPGLEPVEYRIISDEEAMPELLRRAQASAANDDADGVVLNRVLAVGPFRLMSRKEVSAPTSRWPQLVAENFGPTTTIGLNFRSTLHTTTAWKAT